MKKIILFILLPIFAIFIAIFVILFTPFGSNAIIKPIANSLIEKKIKEPKVEITKLNSKFGYIDIDAKSSNGIKANTNGSVEYLDKKFDLAYTINAPSVKMREQEIKVDLSLRGQAVGSVKNFGVNGSGKAFDSDIKYKFIIKNSNPQSIEAIIDSAQISKIFATLNQVPIVDGYLFVNANMPSLDIKNPSGKAHIEVKDGRFNRGFIKREFKILLPKDEKFKAKIDMAVAKKYIIGKGDINTTTAKLKIKKITSTLNFKQAKAYYNLKIDNLARINQIANIKLKGRLDLDGAFYANLAKNIYQFDALTKSLGGKLKLIYNTNRVKLNLKDISIVKVLRMLSLPYYISAGRVNGVVNVADIKHLNGLFDISSSGVINRKLLKVKLPNYKYSIKAKAILKDSILTLKRADINSKFLALNLKNTKYSILTSRAKGDYALRIANLRALESFTKQPLRGKLSASGAFSYAKDNIALNLITKSFGGVLKAKYRGKSLATQFRDISLDKVLYMLNQPHLLSSAFASGDVKIYDIDKLDGKFTLKSTGVVDTKSIKKLYNIELGKLFRYSIFIKDATIKDGILLTKPKLNTTMAAMNFDYLNYDIKKQNLSAKYSLKIDDLRRLQPIIKQQLNGSFSAKGNIKYAAKQLLINGVANELGGVINFMVENSNIKVNGAGISVVKAFKMLNYPPTLDGVAKIDFKYNTKSKNGNFILTLNEARFLNSQLVDNLKQYANFDLSKEIFRSAKIDGTISGDIITFNLNTSSQRVKISTQNAKINTKTQTIDARVKVVQKNQDYNFRITGPIKSPHIKILFGGYIKKKVKKRVLKELEKAGVTKKIDKEIKKIIPNEIKALKDDNATKEKINKIIPKELKGLFNKL